ncbi:ABC-type sugar transport system (probably encoding FT maltose/maltodextrin transporter subunit, also similar to UgpC), ATPase component [Candidatus Phytoplasma mali]|uniref:ABC-type sugar transport system (Probably encoding FT maltose/maltodextrin transporter subunit, also similar to UgpC), ATPase component n=1 Tax=Phytoplasma mali (strain AT) TaxID=482235 RepID=B3R0I2_PHYMT|nr:ABC transporter ATP-binding protein [Candidatus Phytoplasma mali]CAP18346.1 ABC-type sugar transport system (probably encoding FT maltose/maltodextrin transporter subunit, also similar to UgpC), ATPase component [Candidatus Phytoplasma mali]
MSIILKKVSKNFIDSKKKINYAVDNIEMNIKKGSLVTILGPSGCGKSTTLFMIAGLTSVSSGKIFFDEKDVTNLSPEKRGVGLVFQNYSLYPHMTARQNIMFPLENLKKTKDYIKQKIQEISKLLKIEEQLDKKPSELSGGQQQRIAIARALVKEPEVLLMDEPFSNLDVKFRLIMREEIRRIQRKTGITIILVTHDQEEAMSISDEIYLINQGQIQQKGIPQEVYMQPKNLFVAEFLGIPAISVFDGEINNGQVKIGEAVIFNVPELKKIKQEVYIGIRPEGYNLNSKGILEIRVLYFENIGRELILLAFHNKCLKQTFRIIFYKIKKEFLNFNTNQKNFLRFDIKKEKCFIFDKNNGQRIF